MCTSRSKIFSLVQTDNVLNAYFVCVCVFINLGFSVVSSTQSQSYLHAVCIMDLWSLVLFLSSFFTWAHSSPKGQQYKVMLAVSFSRCPDKALSQWCQYIVCQIRSWNKKGSSVLSVSSLLPSVFQVQRKQRWLGRMWCLRGKQYHVLPSETGLIKRCKDQKLCRRNWWN